MKRVGNTIINIIEYAVWYFNVVLFLLLALHVIKDYFLLTKEETYHKTGVELGRAFNISSNVTEAWFIKFFWKISNNRLYSSSHSYYMYYNLCICSTASI